MQNTLTVSLCTVYTVHGERVDWVEIYSAADYRWTKAVEFATCALSMVSKSAPICFSAIL